MMRVRWACVDFFAANVWENSFGVLWVLLDQSMHLGNGRCGPFCVGIVKREPHAENNAPLKALGSVGFQGCWIVMAAAME